MCGSQWQIGVQIEIMGDLRRGLGKIEVEERLYSLSLISIFCHWLGEYSCVCKAWYEGQKFFSGRDTFNDFAFYVGFTTGGAGDQMFWT